MERTILTRRISSRKKEVCRQGNSQLQLIAFSDQIKRENILESKKGFNYWMLKKENLEIREILTTESNRLRQG